MNGLESIETVAVRTAGTVLVEMIDKNDFSLKFHMYYYYELLKWVYCPMLGLFGMLVSIRRQKPMPLPLVFMECILNCDNRVYIKLLHKLTLRSVLLQEMCNGWKLTGRPEIVSYMFQLGQHHQHDFCLESKNSVASIPWYNFFEVFLRHMNIV